MELDVMAGGRAEEKEGNLGGERSGGDGQQRRPKQRRIRRFVERFRHRLVRDGESTEQSTFIVGAAKISCVHRRGDSHLTQF